MYNSTKGINIPGGELRKRSMSTDDFTGDGFLLLVLQVWF